MSALQQAAQAPRPGQDLHPAIAHILAHATPIALAPPVEGLGRTIDFKA